MRTRRLCVTSSIVVLLSGLSLGRQNTAAIPVTIREGTNIAAAVSPDGKTIAVDLLGSLWTLPMGGGAARRITDEFMDARQPAWSPDGSAIAFQAYRDGTWHIWTIAPDGQRLTQVTSGPFDHREPHWSSDGKRLALASDRNGNYDVFELDVASGNVRQLTTNPANDFAPCWSPDGRTIAFVSDRRDSAGVWLISADAKPTEHLLHAATGAVSGVSWNADGSRVSYVVQSGNQTKLMVGPSTSPGAGAIAIAQDEDVFPFRAQWLSSDELLYTADGKIKRRAVTGGAGRTIEFTASVTLDRPAYARRPRTFPPSGPQRARGIIHPAISPDGTRVVFSALGDLWLMPVGSVPQRLTSDPFIETEPAWSPDGRFLAYSVDRDGSMDIWLRNVQNGSERRLTRVAGVELSAAWSHDGANLAFLNERGEIFTVSIETGEVKKAHDALFDPSRPSWSPDGRSLIVTALRPYSTRFREGTNQILKISLDGQPDRVFDPVPHKSDGAREDYGPVWSPDGSKMAFVLDGGLAVLPVRKDGEPAGPPRKLTSELANSPSWTGDSKRLLYQTDESLKLVNVETGEIRDLGRTITWTPKVRSGTTVVHAGRLFDGREATLRQNVDITIEGNRIKAVEAHSEQAHRRGPLIDASAETVMPGLTEMHAHLGKGFGESLGRLWLSYGITTVRNPATNPFEGIEDREAVEAGTRIGPRVFSTGNPFDGTRIYYAGGTSLDGGAELPLELERANRLGYDLVKTYVRLPDLLQKRIVDYAHAHGMPVTSHELYPAVAYGADGVEHIRGTSRRGYSPKITALNRSYQDVIGLLTASKMTLTPTVGIQGGFALMNLRDASWLDDARAETFVPAAQRQTIRAAIERDKGSDLTARTALIKSQGDTVKAVYAGGGRVIAGTDSPINPYGLALHVELELYVFGGLTPYEALRTATVNAAEALGMSAQLGTIEAGKLADLAMVDGDPLADIRNARRVKKVMKDGEVFTLEELLKRPAATGGTKSIAAR
ncbi:MAG: PD40 domain-containing protein [Acidobacteria bacterium]|nr:PD40 domain-containing protein [Acidobacteriota bacterium]